MRWSRWVAGAALLLASVSGVWADEAYLRYVHPPIREPIPDLLNLDVPAEVGNQPLARLGYVDVTAAPFRADSTGRTDATQALQAAITFARDHQMACFFPPGTYRFSDTLECVQQLYRRTNGRVFGGNRFPNLLVGSRAGGRRPKLVLAARSPGFGDPAHPKIALRFWSRGYLNPTTADRVTDGLPPDVEQPNIGMNQMLVNLDLTVEPGNPGAIALRHQAAEGSAIEDCTIDAGDALVGIQGGIGSGGGSTNVTVIGGRVGLDFTGYLSGTQPTPTITAFTLVGQTEAAIRSTSRQTLVAAGLRIEADRCTGPLIQVLDAVPRGQGREGTRPLPANHGALTLVDSQIEFRGDALAAAKRVAIASTRGVYLDNVFVCGATEVLSDADRTATLAGNPQGWLHVVRYAHASSPRADQGVEYRYSVYRDGQPVECVEEIETDEPPPAELQSQHRWSDPFPGFETPGAVDVSAEPYRARGDGRTDDSAALQRAIDEHEVVFLPKGCYRVTRTLELKPSTKLVGVGQHLSLLVATADGAFADPRQPAPIVRTADAADAATVLAFLGLTSAPKVGGATALDWRSGGRSVFRAVEIRLQPREAPPVTVGGHGGGQWYNYRGMRIVVEGTSGPLHFYQFSPQHVTNELRGAQCVWIFGTKYEGNDPMLIVRDCDHIRLFGHGGNAKGRPSDTLFLFERTPNFLFANGVDGPTKIGTRTASHPEGSTDPRQWHMLIDRPGEGAALRLPPAERPVLYLRGNPQRCILPKTSP